jgi:hypothetical protein
LNYLQPFCRSSGLLTSLRSSFLNAAERACTQCSWEAPVPSIPLPREFRCPQIAAAVSGPEPQVRWARGIPRVEPELQISPDRANIPRPARYDNPPNAILHRANLDSDDRQSVMSEWETGRCLTTIHRAQFAQGWFSQASVKQADILTTGIFKSAGCGMRDASRALGEFGARSTPRNLWWRALRIVRRMMGARFAATAV